MRVGNNLGFSGNYKFLTSNKQTNDEVFDAFVASTKTNDKEYQLERNFGEILLRTPHPQWSSLDFSFIKTALGVLPERKGQLYLNSINTVFNANAAPVRLPEVVA